MNFGKAFYPFALTIISISGAQASTRPIFTGSDRASVLLVADGPSGHDDTNQLFEFLTVAPTQQPLGVVQKDDASPDERVIFQCRLGKLMPLASCGVTVTAGPGVVIDVAKREFHYSSSDAVVMEWARKAFVWISDDELNYQSVDRAFQISSDGKSVHVDYKSFIVE